MSIVDVKPQLVLGMRAKGKYSLIAELLPRVYEYLFSKGARISGHPIFVCHEPADEAEKADLEGTADVEVAVPVVSEVEESEDIKCYTLPGGKMAKTIHRGPYDKCAQTYDRLFSWIQGQGKKVSGPIRELYLNDPNEVKEEEILTEIYVPVE